MSIHQQIARDAFGCDDYILLCDKCNRIEEPTTQQMGEYLRTGWPECCGQTMQLVRVEEGGAA